MSGTTEYAKSTKLKRILIPTSTDTNAAKISSE
jgi:hypothetical protein